MNKAQKTIQEFKDARVKVEELLAGDERCRNNDLWLLLQYWERMNLVKIIVDYEAVQQMTPAETITRVRREIQNKMQKYLPTDPQVIIDRRIRQEVVHDYYAGINPKITEEVIKMRYAIK